MAKSEPGSSMAGGAFVTHRIRRILRHAQDAMVAGRYEELLETARRCVDVAPQIEDGWFLLAQAQASLGYNHDGLEQVEQAIIRFPDHDPLQVQRCKFLFALGKRRECLQQIQSLLAKGEPDQWSSNVLAKLLVMLDEVPLALPLRRKACANGTGSARRWLDLAICERYCGDFDAAREHLSEALRLEPGNAHAYWVLASLRKANETDNSITSIDTALQAQNLVPLDESYLQFARGKELEDLERWDEAFDAVTAAGAARRKSRPYDHRHSEDLVDTLIHLYDGEIIDVPGAGCDSDEPIFIVGLPRTGTTLVERILGCHDDVFAAGELRQFALAVHARTDGDGGPVLTAQQIVASTAFDFRDLGETYIETTRPRTGHTPRFTDKMPVNFLYLGLIAKALPRARIIHVTRNPMDTCWSNFKQFFGDLYEYSYNLEDTARFILLYDRLMSHWREVLPGRFIDLAYEDLINDPEHQTRRLLEYCDLSWQQECLEFDRSPEAVTTASSVQVREPIYARSVQRWKHLEHRLQPAKAIFDAGGLEY